jgi:DNA primase
MPLADLLTARGFQLRPAGRGRMVALCPFHEDRRRPNLVVFTGDQRFRCFACGARGDVVDLVQHLDRHLDFTSALRALADQLAVPWPEGRADGTDDSSRVLALSAQTYAGYLQGAPLDYLQGRGLPEAFLRAHQVGYAPAGMVQVLRNALRQAGVSAEAAFAAGVVARAGSDGRAVVRDFFAVGGGGFLIFPNPGRRGAILDLQGRAFPEAPGKPKYLNLPRSRRYLFNEAALPTPSVILAEGIPDALSCLLVDLPAVAVYGTGGFSARAVNRFTRCRRVYVAFDADATDRTVEIAVQFGLRGRVLGLPGDLGARGDLNDLLIRLGPDAFRAQLLSRMVSAPTGYEVAIDRLSAETRPWDLFEEAGPLLAQLAHLEPISRDYHLQLFHAKYGIPMETLRDAAQATAELASPEAAGDGPGAARE